MKGTGGTKTEWYFLFSPHCGIVNAHTNALPGNRKTALEGASMALVILKRDATTCSALIVGSPVPTPILTEEPQYTAKGCHEGQG